MIILYMIILPFQNEEAPFPHVFAQFGWIWVKWIVTIGAIFALSASVFGSMYMVPRVFYAMATDGLIFKIFGSIHPKTKTPQIATIFSGIVSGKTNVYYFVFDFLNGNIKIIPYLKYFSCLFMYLFKEYVQYFNQ